MILRFNFTSKTFCAALELFKRMEVAESIYKGAQAPYQTKQAMTDSNISSGCKKQGGESASYTGSKNNCAHKRKNKYIYRSKGDNIDTPLCMIHCDGHSSEECKDLRDYGPEYKNQTFSLGFKTCSTNT